MFRAASGSWRSRLLFVYALLTRLSGIPTLARRGPAVMGRLIRRIKPTWPTRRACCRVYFEAALYGAIQEPS